MTISPETFIKELDVLTARFGGKLLQGVQSASSSMSPVAYDGKLHPNATHLNTARFLPAQGGGWLERGHLTVCTAALVLDDVGNDAKAPNFPRLKPTAMIATSPGSEQWVYVLAEPVDVKTGKGLTAAAVQAGLSDEFIANRHHHWWRLPGSLPAPKIAQGRTVPARLIEWTGEAFTLAQLKSGLGITPLAAPGDLYLGSTDFDYETAQLDPVLNWFRRTRNLGAGPDSRGFYDVLCPKWDLHTDQNRKCGRYVPPNAHSAAGYICHHAHCRGLDVTLLRQWVEINGGPSASSAALWARRMYDLRKRLDKLPPAERRRVLDVWLATFNPDLMKERLRAAKGATR